MRHQPLYRDFKRKCIPLPFHIVLYQPEIPQNTGNIARTCAVTGARLHIIKPMGFSVDDRYLRRAGLDYWDKLDLTYYESLDDFFAKTAGARLYFSTTKAQKNYCDAAFQDGDYIMFGRESAGIPDEVLAQHLSRCIRIPMRNTLRSLNLSNSVAIVLYEALRQTNFHDLLEISPYFSSERQV